MNYGSVCSGIEAATVAWHPLGWKPSFFSEIEKFPKAVLAHHYPDVPDRGDMTKFKEWPDEPIDLLVGGTPCQSFSVAGLRKGLDDPRGNLALVFLAIADRLRPSWLVWENVPGVLSSAKGRDFGSLLGAMGKLGYGCSYRVLDAQYFGVPQRRRRVFVVGHLGDARPTQAVLFERHILQGHPAPSREAGERPSNGVARCLRGRSNAAHREDHDTYIPQVSHALNVGGMGRQDYETEPLVAHSLRGEGHDASEDGTGRGVPIILWAITIGLGSDPLVAKDKAQPVTGRNGDPGVVAFDTTQVTSKANRSNPTLDKSTTPAVAFTQNSRSEGRSLGDKTGAVTSQPGAQCQNYVKQSMAVRRLTPRECERLQGFPDDYTLVPYRGKPAADGPRYKALGNSMAVPVMRWIGERIKMVQESDKETI